MNTPALIEYGTVHDLHHLMDFGRVEARVRLFFEGAAENDPGVEIVTNVVPFPNETEASIKSRLVVSAARLFRQFELKEFESRAEFNQPVAA